MQNIETTARKEVPDIWNLRQKRVQLFQDSPHVMFRRIRFMSKLKPRHCKDESSSLQWREFVPIVTKVRPCSDEVLGQGFAAGLMQECIQQISRILFESLSERHPNYFAGYGKNYIFVPHLGTIWKNTIV